MNVLVACEYSGIVRDAFLDHGHTAISCDILPCESEKYIDPSLHYEGDIFDCLKYYKKNYPYNFDLMIAHPPCTHLAVSGARFFKEKIADGRQQAALNFVQQLMDVDIQHICIENPVSVISSNIRKPDQIIQPWMFGESITKTTCLWLKNLPKLEPTNIVGKGEFYEYISCKGIKRRGPMWHLKSGKGTGKKRSKFFPGIAVAMANQWGKLK